MTGSLLRGGAMLGATVGALAGLLAMPVPAALATGAPVACVPSVVNRSALLPGSTLAVSPLPDSRSASPYTQISLLGANPYSLHVRSVVGSASGTHGGRLRIYSQGDGASFVPAHPFRAGETVTVIGRAGGHPFLFHFTVDVRDVLPHPPPSPPTVPHPGDLQSFHSRPDLVAPTVAVSTAAAGVAPGYVLATPYSGPGRYGPLIFDRNGQTVWFDPLPAGTAAADLKAQSLDGHPVLTWWQGYIPPQGFGEGEDEIVNDAYQLVARVRAGNGLMADLHEFTLTRTGTALITAYAPMSCDLSSLGGPAHGYLTDSVMQEIDVRTGLVRREWHAVDHVGLGETHNSPRAVSPHLPLDFFHLNSIDPLSATRMLLSARNTWALYELDDASGRVREQVGGRGTTVRMGPGTGLGFQHDARALPDGTISVFDNGGVPPVHSQSRALILRIARGRASLVRQLVHAPGLLAGSQGNAQALPGGDVFVGWGAQPVFSEYGPTGTLLFDARLPRADQSYRGLLARWTATPIDSPAIAAGPGPDSRVMVWASWNGATEVTAWRLLTGAQSSTLLPAGDAPRSGFETALSAPPGTPFVAVQALDAAGHVLGQSKTIPG